MEQQSPSLCLNCGRSDLQVPLVSLRYAGHPTWICPQCLPLLIHQPGRLADKLPGLGDIAGTPEDHEQ